VERDDASVAHGGEAEPGVAQRGAVRVLAVDEAQVGAVRERAGVDVLRAELDRRDLAQVGARHRSEQGEHALGAVVRVLPPVADLRALVRLHERTRIDRRDVVQPGSATSAWSEPPRCEPISRYRNVPSIVSIVPCSARRLRRSAADVWDSMASSSPTSRR
jgi:hypothetical protein